MASLVWPLARASSHRPSSTSPTITVELSKYVCGSRPAWSMTDGKSVTKTLKVHAAVVPAATSVSIVVVPCRAARTAAT